MQRAHARPSIASPRPQLVERGQRRLAEPLRLLLDPRRRVDRAPAQPPLDEVDRASARAPSTAIGGTRRARAAAALPGVAQQLRAARARAASSRAGLRRLDRVRHPERAEHRLERRAPALERRRDQRDPLGRRAAADELEQLLADQLERAARAGAFEEADGAVELGAATPALDEQRALEMRERRMRVLGRARRRAPRCARGERGEIRRRSARSDAKAMRPGSYGSETLHLGASGQRLEQRPLRTGQVLEAVGEHRLAVPRVELALQPLRGAPAEQVASQSTEPVELGAVGAVEHGEVAVEVARLEQARLELRDRLEQRVGEAAGAR